MPYPTPYTDEYMRVLCNWITTRRMDPEIATWSRIDPAGRPTPPTVIVQHPHAEDVSDEVHAELTRAGWVVVHQSDAPRETFYQPLDRATMTDPTDDLRIDPKYYKGYADVRDWIVSTLRRTIERGDAINCPACGSAVESVHVVRDATVTFTLERHGFTGSGHIARYAWRTGEPALTYLDETVTYAQPCNCELVAPYDDAMIAAIERRAGFAQRPE